MEPMDYRKSGVDIDKANEIVKEIVELARKTYRVGVLGSIGGFGGLFSIPLHRWKEPVLVSSTDGVGTKLKIAILSGVHHTIGIDLVAMCANDVVVQGAEPMFFLDYFATGQLEKDVARDVIRGIAQGCVEAGCALIGGETAEMPGMYRPGHYDLAGFCVGIVEKSEIVDGSKVRVGDIILGIGSSGLHSNGYSLARRLFFQRLRWKVDRYVPELGCTLGEELLRPTIIYVKSVLALKEKIPINAMAHITGGGLAENIPRVLPRGVQAYLRWGSWEVPPIFKMIQERGKVAAQEMVRVFNNGIGMVVVMGAHFVDRAMEILRGMGQKAWVIGEVGRGDGRPKVVFYQ